MLGIVSKHELAIITGKQLPSAQCRALGFMRIPFILRPDGSPCVLQKALEQSCGVHSNDSTEKDVTLNLEAI